MRSDRKKVPLSEFITLQRGFDLPSKDRIDGTVPVVASTQITGWHNESKVEGPGVVIGRSGSIGGGQFISEDFWPLNTTLWVKNFKNHDPEFVYYLLRSIDFERFNVGSGVPTLNRNHLSSVEVPLFNEEEEVEIANHLGTLDKKIHLNRQTNETLEAMAQVIFKSWFVDFDPVRAKVKATSAGRDPNRAAMAAIAGVSLEQPTSAEASEGRDWDEIEAALDHKLTHMTGEQRHQLSRTSELFPDELEESEIGKVPKGWGVVEYKSITKVLNGYAFKSKDYLNNSDGIFVLRTKNFGDSGIVERLKDDVYLPNEFMEDYSKYLCEPFDLQMVMVGASLGKLGMILPYHLPALRNQNMWCFRAKKETHKFFIDHYLKWSVPKMLSLASGSARSFFRKGDFQKMDVILPSEKLITEFNKMVKPFYHRISTNESEINTLSKLRDTLLPKLISGEVGI